MAALRLLSVFLTLLLAVAAAAQNRVLIPEKIERETVVGDDGVQRWADWKPAKCPNCEGKKKVKCPTCERFSEEAPNCIECKRNEKKEADCRMCAGAGELPDPLDKVSCPGCRGAGFLLCTICGGGGRLRIGDDKKFGDCVGCRGTGGWKCGACNGSRLVEPAGLKPSLKEATGKDLAKAAAVTDSALKELGAITPSGGDKARKEVKAMVKAFDLGGAVPPAHKRLGKPFEDYMSKIYAGKQFQGSDEKEAQTMAMVKDGAEYYLKHQKRRLELAQKRAEATAKAAGESKGK
ncbi:MAG: hypothetical protein ACK5BN_13560 [Planctomycetota bacterium]